MGVASSKIQYASSGHAVSISSMDRDCVSQIDKPVSRRVERYTGWGWV
jgi:hypothetical protein